MALNLQNKYPGRFDPVSADYPQGKFKNRSSPTAQDGSYMERDWLNDWAGFFGALLNRAGVVPNGNVDTAQSSQLYDALKSLFLLTTGTATDSNKLGGVLASQYAQLSQVIGVGQSWQNVSSSRVLNTTYTNSSGKPIEVALTMQGTNSYELCTVVVSGVTLYSGDPGVGSPGTAASLTFVVPNGGTYIVTMPNGAITTWSELR